MGVLPCNQQILFVYSVRFGTHCVQSLVHQYITEVRDLSGAKGKSDFKKKKNKAIRKVRKQLLMQHFFTAFAAIVEKRGV